MTILAIAFRLFSHNPLYFKSAIKLRNSQTSDFLPFLNNRNNSVISALLESSFRRNRRVAPIEFSSIIYNELSNSKLVGYVCKNTWYKNENKEYLMQKIWKRKHNLRYISKQGTGIQWIIIKSNISLKRALWHYYF